jgi:hypothetical protein
MAFPQDWGNRYALRIDGSVDGELTDYQIDVGVGYRSGMKSDFGDIRFTSSDGTTELKYHLVSKTDGDVARFVVKVPSIAASPSVTTVYVYYGNSSATTTSDPANVYDIFDDFSGSDVWLNSGGASHSITSSQLSCAGNTDGIVYHPTDINGDFIFEFKHVSSSTGYWGSCVICNNGSNVFSGYLLDIAVGSPWTVNYGNGSSWTAIGTTVPSLNKGSIVQIKKVANDIYIIVDEVTIATRTDTHFSSGKIGFRQLIDRNKVIDDVKVRKTTPNPPSCCPFINVSTDTTKINLTINQEKYTDWLWQNQLEVTGSVDGQLTNYPVLITVPYDNEFMRTDFQDIRFGTDYGLNLPFFLRRKVDGDFAEFFVKIPVIPQSPDTITIFLYAGNDQAPDRSDIYNTFPFGDDFDEKYVAGLDTSKWTSYIPYNSYIDFNTPSVLHIHAQAATAVNASIRSIATFGENYVFGVKAKLSVGTWTDNHYIGFNNGANNKGTHYILEQYSPNVSNFVVKNNDTEEVGSDHIAIYPLGSEYHIYEIQNKPTGGIKENIDFGEDITSTKTISTFMNANLITQGHSVGIGGGDMWIDYVYVRPSIDNEPTIGELDIWATTTHSDIYQALVNIPYFSDIQAEFCIRPLREDFQALIHITGSSEKLIKALIKINAANQSNYINYVQAFLTINPNAKNKDIQTFINIGKVLSGSIELKGRILYNYNRDETTTPGEDSNKQFVMKLGGRIYG